LRAPSTTRFPAATCASPSHACHLFFFGCGWGGVAVSSASRAFLYYRADDVAGLLADAFAGFMDWRGATFTAFVRLRTRGGCFRGLFGRPVWRLCDTPPVCASVSPLPVSALTLPSSAFLPCAWTISTFCLLPLPLPCTTITAPSTLHCYTAFRSSMFLVHPSRTACSDALRTLLTVSSIAALVTAAGGWRAFTYTPTASLFLAPARHRGRKRGWTVSRASLLAWKCMGHAALRGGRAARVPRRLHVYAASPTLRCAAALCPSLSLWLGVRPPVRAAQVSLLALWADICLLERLPAGQATTVKTGEPLIAARAGMRGRTPPASTCLLPLPARLGAQRERFLCLGFPACGRGF